MRASGGVGVGGGVTSRLSSLLLKTASAASSQVGISFLFVTGVEGGGVLFVAGVGVVSAGGGVGVREASASVGLGVDAGDSGGVLQVSLHICFSCSSVVLHTLRMRMFFRNFSASVFVPWWIT